MKTTNKQPAAKPVTTKGAAQTNPTSKLAEHKHIIINSVLIGIAVGLLAFAIFRFATYQPPKDTHYHANWQVWINGQQQTFAEPTYYQEEVTCAVDDATNPLHRAHMHDNTYDVIHVHADAVTYSQFLENINLAAQPNYLRLGNSTYQDNGPNKLTFVLNGKVLPSLNGVVIKSEDKLLINYGPETDAELIARDGAMDNKAYEHNHEQDPASCSGSHETSWQDRLKGIWQ